MKERIYEFRTFVPCSWLIFNHYYIFKYPIVGSLLMKQTKKTHSISKVEGKRSVSTDGLKQDSLLYKRKFILAMIVGIWGFCLYLNTLGNGYVLDDFSAIKENNIVRQGIHAIPEIFKTSYRQGYLSVKDGLYRPLSLALFAIEWNYFPDNPSVAHLVNIILYGLTGFFLFLFLYRLASFESHTWREAFAFIASLTFITHPLHVEVVANIKSCDEVLSLLFILLTFLALFRFMDEGKNKFLLLAIVSYGLSLLSKESSITFLALLPIVLYFFVRAGLKRTLLLTSCFVGVAALYLFLRASVLQGASVNEGISVADNVIVEAHTFSTRMGTAFYILALYFKLLVFPKSLSYDYSYQTIPVVPLTNPVALLSCIFFLAIGIYAAISIIKSFKTQPINLLILGIVFFLIPASLVSNIIIVIGTSMGDRLMYFPSLGFSICIAFLLQRLLKIEKIAVEGWNAKVRFIPVALILIIFSVRTWYRNPDWKNNYTLYSHDVKLVPNSVKAHYYLGLEIIKEVAANETDPQNKIATYKEGINELEKSIQIMPTFSSPYTQMGVAYHHMKDYGNAIKYYNKALELTAADAVTLNNIGSVYFEWRKYPEAETKFREALHIDPQFVDAYINLGSAQGTIRDFNNAIISFQNAIRYAPDNANAYYFMALTYSNLGDKANADKYYQVAQQLNPQLRKP